MASPQAIQVLHQYPHRTPLDRDQIRALCNALTSLNRILGDDTSIKTSVYCAILRLLKAHVTPIPTHASVTFAQVQAARLQLLAEKLLSERKPFPHQLTAAIAQGLVSGFDPATRLQIPPERQKQQLQQQQLADRHQLLEDHKQLTDRQADFSRTRNACINVMRARERQQAGPDPDLFVPWEKRNFKLPPASQIATPPTYARLDEQTLSNERQRYLRHCTGTVVKDIEQTLEAHKSNAQTLAPRETALLETRLRHAKLLSLQTKMRKAVWDGHQPTERDGRRGPRGRARTLKQLQREFEKVDRARVRQIEAEERDARRKRQAWMNAMVDHLNKFRSYHRDVVRRGMRAVTKAVMKYHEEVSRNANRAEREAERARIQKLKDDDEEGYLQLVRQTKNTRLLELLDQTDKYLKELGAVVKEERAKSGVVEYENGRQKPGSRVDYYEIAHAIKEDVHEQSSLLVGGKLKEYQLHGIQWMVSLYNNRLNGILADEMGLGKTIQTLGLIAHLMETKENPGPYLIIVPLSTISNWELEFARWAPAIRVVVFKGDAKARKKLYEEVIEKKSFNVCLVTYEYVVRGKNLLKRVEWQHLVIDEGHRIKNHESRLSSVLHAHYRSRNRLLLTGTPLQNSLTELWALLNFLLPNVFKSAESFESWFAAPFAQMGVGNVATTDDQAQLTEEESLLIIRRLHQVLRPFLLRRLKSDVLRMGEQLPEKQEHVILVEMSAWQRAMYLKIVKSERVLFTDRHGRQRYDKLPNPAVQLRKCVNHPYLFYADHASKIVDSPQLWRASGKFDMLDSCVMKLLHTGHRILIFNQMTKVVDLQERLLRYRNIPFYRLDGTTATEDRKQMVNDFNDETTTINVFLLTTRAGGLGVNLQTADTVIIFDSDWNPSMDQQAQDRAHRIGQRREVLVIRMLTAKSIEEDVMERASFKRGLEKKIIRAGMFDEQSKDSERQAMLRELLRVEGPGSDDDHPEDGLPTDEEVNRILARSEDEYEIFTKIDQNRAEEVVPRPRLLVEKEVPEWASKVPKALLQKAKVSGAGDWATFGAFDVTTMDMPKKRRAATTNVSYGVDQLSERQYIKLMERSEAGEELSYDTVRNATRKRKRRKKGELGEGEGEGRAEGDNDESSLRISDGAANEDTRKESPGSDPMFGSKSLNTDLKSFDDDVTEGGDHSAIPSGGEDIVIEDEDDDEDDAGPANDDNNVDDSERDVVVTPGSERESDSEFSDGSESASEPPAPPVRGRKRGRPPKFKVVEKRQRRETESRDSSEVKLRNSTKWSRSPSVGREASRSESSEDSPSPIRRTASRKRPKISVTNLRSAPVADRACGRADDEIGKLPEAKKARTDSEIRIPRLPRPEEGDSSQVGPAPDPKVGTASQSSNSTSKHLGSVPINGTIAKKSLAVNSAVPKPASPVKQIIPLQLKADSINSPTGASGGNHVGISKKTLSNPSHSNSSVPPVPRKSSLSSKSQKLPSSGIAKRFSSMPSGLKKGVPLPVLPKIPASAPAPSTLGLSAVPPVTVKKMACSPATASGPKSISSKPTIGAKPAPAARSQITRSAAKPTSTEALPPRSLPTVPNIPRVGAIPRKPLPLRSENMASNGPKVTRPIATARILDKKGDTKVEEDEAEDGEIREEGELSEDGEVLGPKRDNAAACRKPHNDQAPLSSAPSRQVRENTATTARVPLPRAPRPTAPGNPRGQQTIGGRSLNSPGTRGNAPSLTRPLPSSSVPAGVSISRPGVPTIPRAGGPIPARSGAMPVRPSIQSGVMPTMRGPSGPPTSAPIIAMPRVPTAGGMRPPMGMAPPPGGMINHGAMVPPPIMPMAQGMGQHYLYGMRGGPAYGGVGMYGPRMAGSLHRGAHDNFRPPFNPRQPGGSPQSSARGRPIGHVQGLPPAGGVPPLNAEKSSPVVASGKQSDRRSDRDRGGSSTPTGVTRGRLAVENVSEASVGAVDGKALVSGKGSAAGAGIGAKNSKNVVLKDVEDGEEGEIEEEGEIVEES